MAIRFITQTRTIPTGTGIAKTSGAVDGFYYAVDRTAANPTAYLADNTANWFNNTTQVTFTTNIATITTAITDLRINSGGTSATTFVAIDKTFIFNAGSRLIKATGNQIIYFINCTFIINSAQAWATYTFGHNSTGGDANAQLDFGPSQSTNGGMMFYGCTFINTTATVWGFAPSEMIGCSFAGSSAGADQPLIGAGRNGRYITSDISGNQNSAFKGWQMYGIPGAINNCQFGNITFGNLGNGQAGPLLLNAPSFTFPGQTQYYQGNTPTLADQVAQIYGGVQYATTGAGWMSAAGTGFFGWGGTDAARGYAGFVNYQGLGFTFQDFSAAAVRNVRLRVRSNHQLNTGGATLVARLPTTTTAQQNVIQGFLSDSQGRLNYENFATDGTTFTAGYLNYLTGQTSSTAPATAGRWNINANSVATPDYTPIVLASVGRPTGSGASPTINYTNTQVAWDIRSFTNSINLTGSRDYSTQLNVQLSDLGSRQTAALNANVKTDAVTAMNAVTNGNIDSYFLGRFPSTIGTTDVNDVFDAARYEWFNFALATEPTADANGNVNVGNANFTLNQAATGGTIATKGYTYDAGANTWIVRASYFLTNSANRVNGGVITTGTITLTSQATAVGTYAPLTAATIACNGTTVFQPLTATTAITGLPTSGVIVNTAAVNFGSSTITATGDLSFINATLSGTCTLNVGVTDRNLTLNNCGDLSVSFPFTRMGTSEITVLVSGNTVVPATLPAGFQVLVPYTVLLNNTVGITDLTTVRVNKLYINNASSSPTILTLTSGANGITASWNGNAMLRYDGVLFVDGLTPHYFTKAAGSTSVTVTPSGGVVIDPSLLDFTQRANFTAADTTFINSCLWSVLTSPTPEINLSVSSAAYDRTSSREISKMVIRAMMERDTTQSYHFGIAQNLTTSGVTLTAGWGPSSLGTMGNNAWTVRFFKSTASNNVVVLNLWNTDSLGLARSISVSQVDTQVQFAGFSPGAVAQITGQDIENIANGVEEGLIGTQANPGALSEMSRGIESAQLLIPKAIPLPPST